MAKFCKYCGKELEEGAVCNCEAAAAQQNAPVEEVPVQDAAPASAPAFNFDNVKKSGANFFEKFMSFVKSPVSIGEKLVNSCDFKKALIIMGVQAGLVGLLVLIIFAKLNSSIDYELFPVFSSFLVSAIVTFAASAVQAAALMLCIKLFKGNTTYNYMLCASSVGCCAVIPFLAASVVLALILPIKAVGNPSLIGLTVPVIIASLSSALGEYMIISVMRAGSEYSKDRFPYIMFCAALILAVAVYILLRIFLPMCMPEVPGFSGNPFGSMY